jgi:hypothetical protein
MAMPNPSKNPTRRQFLKIARTIIYGGGAHPNRWPLEKIVDRKTLPDTGCDDLSGAKAHV